MLRLLLGLVLWSFGLDLRVSGCSSCPDSPEFSSSSLVVEMGGPANVSCQLCRHSCVNSSSYGLEAPEGNWVKNGTTLAWTVDRFTQWKANFICYYILDGTTQCCANLPVVSYYPPRNLSLLSETGPVMEGQNVILRCDVTDVAFVGFLHMAVYREHVLVRYMTRNSPTRHFFNWTVEHDFIAGKDDQAARFWCEAKLDLDVGTERRFVVFRSSAVTTEVHYKPRLQGPRQPAVITLSAGDRVQLNCTAEGNPAPNYTWTHQASPLLLAHDAVLTMESVNSGSAGEYVCNASNVVGTETFRVTVVVEADYKYIIVASVLSVATLAAVIFAIIYARYYSLSRTGQYNLLQVFQLTRSKAHS